MSKHINTPAGCAAYDAFVGMHGSANDRRIRAEQWFKENPDAWVEVIPVPDMTTKQRNAFRYRIETPQPPPVVTVDSRPAHEGYPTFDFAINHPANRR
jgi:CO/xanthine dehydrogenase FAD-binding subunit